MAKKQIVSYSYACDVCGDPIPGSAGAEATRKVSWEGTEYVVDVCETHSSQLVDLLRQLNVFVGAGHRSGGQRGRRAAAATTSRAPRQSAAGDGAKASAAKRGDLGAIRSWAQANGHKVGDRGRIPAVLIQAYEAANATSLVSVKPDIEMPETPKSDAAPARRAPRKAATTANGTAKATTRKRTPRKAEASMNGTAANGSTVAKATRKRAPRKATAEASAS